MRAKYSRIVTMKIEKTKECNTRTSQEVTHPSTTLAQARLTSSYDGIRCFTTGMIVSDILALILPLILAPRHPETTCGPRATASYKYFTTPHPYRSKCYNRRMCGKYSRIVTTQNRKKECNMRTSQEVTHPSTTRAQACLTSVF